MCSVGGSKLGVGRVVNIVRDPFPCGVGVLPYIGLRCFINLHKIAGQMVLRRYGTAHSVGGGQNQLGISNFRPEFLLPHDIFLRKLHTPPLVTFA